MKNPLHEFIDQVFEDIEQDNQRRREAKKTRALLMCGQCNAPLELCVCALDEV